MTDRRLRAILFDLDGTLVDSAPDLVGTLNDLRRDRQLPPMPYAPLRHKASLGAMGLLQAGFPELDDNALAELRDDFIERYRSRIWQDSHCFEGVEATLKTLSASGLELGIVTNKIESLARPLVEQAGWRHLFKAVVGGDSTPRPKPDPSPVLEACRSLRVAPGECVMVGDDERDIQSGRSAGAATIVALWGYISPSDQPGRWGADSMFHGIEELIEWIKDPKNQKGIKK